MGADAEIVFDEPPKFELENSLVFARDGNPRQYGVRHRYYGPQYPRGDWMQLRKILMDALRARRPTTTVWYESDDGCLMPMAVTPRMITLMDQHWRSGSDEYMDDPPKWAWQFIHWPPEEQDVDWHGHKP